MGYNEEAPLSKVNWSVNNKMIVESKENASRKNDEISKHQANLKHTWTLLSGCPMDYPTLPTVQASRQGPGILYLRGCTLFSAVHPKRPPRRRSMSSGRELGLPLAHQSSDGGTTSVGRVHTEVSKHTAFEEEEEEDEEEETRQSALL